MTSGNRNCFQKTAWHTARMDTSSVLAIYRDFYFWPMLFAFIFWLPFMAMAIFAFYWNIQLVKAIIRALDRWNPEGGKTPSQQESRTPFLPPASESQKYGPKV